MLSKDLLVQPMTAREKLAEADFFLHQLMLPEFNAFWDDATARNYKYYVSACVWALNASYDHLLYDYAPKYWPKLGTSDFLDRNGLDLVAKATDNAEAKEFLDWYGKGRGRIEQNKDARTVLKVRRLEAHRATPSYSFSSYFDAPVLHDVVNASGAITLGKYERQLPSQPVPVLKTVVHFEGYPEKPVQEVIEAALVFLNVLVTEAETKFGIPPSKPSVP